MPITGTQNDLGDALWAAVKTSTSFTPSSPADDNKGRDVWRAAAGALITHIVSNALVSTVVATTGTASAQSGTGTGGIS